MVQLVPGESELGHQVGLGYSCSCFVPVMLIAGDIQRGRAAAG